jgi:UDP-GlcNAc:undecaprenyl-phosphate/decaprenyl-phosphate GlcNAc-1-phosphate transferase
MLENTSLLYFLSFLAALGISSLSVPFLKTIAFRYSILDLPVQSHKTHAEPIPYLGGIAIVLPIVLLTILGPIIVPMSQEIWARAILIVIPGLILSVVGLVDDVKNVSALPRFIIQTSVAIVISLLLIESDYSVSITPNNYLNFLFSILWIVGITNAINFIDNLDGGAAGITLISSFTIFVLAIHGNQHLIAAFSLTISGASLGFLYWNRNPASIYLGDSGALFVGLLLSVLLLQFEPSANSLVSSVTLPIFVLAIPIIDTSVVVISRIFRGVSIFQGGRDHLSHRLIASGRTRKEAAMILWSLSSFFSSLSIVSEFMDNGRDLISAFGLALMVLLLYLFLRKPHL